MITTQFLLPCVGLLLCANEHLYNDKAANVFKQHYQDDWTNPVEFHAEPEALHSRVEFEPVDSKREYRTYPRADRLVPNAKSSETSSFSP
mmetsp:Transcript_28686/g.44072  ORF Transcript_28686/g.44072 Transcript_28686/m.44072 type:complete len:90 (-) Transcript_28686:126-395(-)